jgi:hypothetical protein
MGLETPLALLGLLAAGLPFLLHRIRQRDLPIARLPTLLLLRRAQARESRRYRITDLLLLALRVGVIVAMCVALAKPYWSRSLPYGDGKLASVAIVLDDSMSMQQRVQGTPLWERARRRALDIARSLPAGSELSIVLAGQPARIWQARSDRLGEVLRRLRLADFATHRGTALPQAVPLALRQLAGSRLADRRLVVLTDRAAHARLADVVWPDAPVQVEVPDMGSSARSVANLAVTQVHVGEDPAAADGLTVWAEVRRFASDVASTDVRLVGEREELARTRATFEGDVARVSLQVPAPKAQQAMAAWVRIPGHDAFPFDDQRAVLLRPKDALRVLLVNGDPHPSKDRDELRYAAAALRLAPSADGAIALHTIDESMLGSAVLADVDVAVLANVRAPAAPIATRLARFVQAGGGLLIAGGDRIDAAAYRAAFGELLPAHLSAVARGLRPVALEAAGIHPALPAGSTGVTRAHATGRLVLDATRALAALEVPIRFADGLPMLAIGRVGKGRSAVWATTLDDDWSDLPYRPGYLPMLVELVRYLSPTPPSRQGNLLPGQPVTLALPAGWRHAEVLDPSGQRHRIDNEGDTTRFPSAFLPGPYRVWMDTESGAWSEVSRAAFVVAAPAEESDLRPDVLPERIASVDAPAATQSGVAVRQAAAPGFFLLAALLAMLEGLVRLRLRRP